MRLDTRIVVVLKTCIFDLIIIDASCGFLILFSLSVKSLIILYLYFVFLVR